MNLIGKEVNVKDKGKGVLVGVSQRYNGTWVVLINGKNEEIHDQYITHNGNYLPIMP